MIGESQSTQTIIHEANTSIINKENGFVYHNRRINKDINPIAANVFSWRTNNIIISNVPHGGLWSL